MPPLRHFPALLLATTFTLGGLWPLISPIPAMQEFGLPSHMLTHEAQQVFRIYASRMTCMGIMIGAFYARKMYGSIDILFFTLGWAGLVDGLICFQEGETGRAMFRAVSGIVVAGLGGWGVTGR